MRLAATLAVALVAAAPALAENILSARLAEPTTRYDHGVLGDAVEFGALEIVTGPSPRRTWRILLPQDSVFEDVEARLWDVTSQPGPEIVVVRSRLDRGASLAIYAITPDGPAEIAATSPIGQPHRWLSPVGAADLDGDGVIEIAFVDRPHLVRELVLLGVVETAAGVTLRQVARAEDLTNHRIGDALIQGGLVTCGGAPRLLLADGGWQRRVSVGWQDGRLIRKDEGPYAGPASLDPGGFCR